MFCGHISSFVCGHLVKFTNKYYMIWNVNCDFIKSNKTGKDNNKHDILLGEFGLYVHFTRWVIAGIKVRYILLNMQ